MPNVTQINNSNRSNKLQTFADENDRKRLTPAAITGVKNLAKVWRLKREIVSKLIDISPTTWDRYLDNPSNASLSQDQLTRVSALIGIFKGLRLLFADDMSDRWPKLKNSGPLFNDHTPIEVMLEGGIPTMLEVRRHIDALRGGL